ncbi:LysE family translocator [Acinetobacter soli]|uniref:LysE family translocator n=1 Tax=Acinetobacter soli TaxID=487316 RepID=UPI00300802AF
MISWFFVGLVAAILLTPGPTNTLLASSGIQVGVRASLKLIPAEVTGYIISISFWGLLIGLISQHFALLPTILKLLSAFYILYLTIKLWRTADHQQNLSQPTIRFTELLCATILNPKGLLFASAIFPQAAWSNMHLYGLHMAVFLMLIIPIATFWIVVGALLAKNRTRWFNPSNLQRTASLILVSFSIPLSYSAFLKF